jgi:hypothetical protein
MLIGVIGCGKTTYSRTIWERAPSRTIRICLDDIIQMMTFYSYQKVMKEFYWELERSPLIKGLTSGFSIILDRTNLTSRTRSRYLAMVSIIRETAKRLSSVPLRNDFGLISFQEQQRFAYKAIVQKLDREMEAFNGTYDDDVDGQTRSKVLQGFREAIEKKFASTWEISLFDQERDTPEGENIFSFLTRVAALETVGVFFDIPVELCLERRLNDHDAKKRETYRKINWKSVMSRMKEEIEEPVLDEGFDRVIRVNEEGRVLSEIGQKSLF